MRNLKDLQALLLLLVIGEQVVIVLFPAGLLVQFLASLLIDDPGPPSLLDSLGKHLLHFFQVLLST